MNATSLQELRAAQGNQDPQDERLDKLRELLLGDHARETEASLAAIAARLDSLEASVSNQLDALSARIEAMAGSLEADRRASFLELSKNVEGLAERIRALSKG